MILTALVISSVLLLCLVVYMISGIDSDLYNLKKDISSVSKDLERIQLDINNQQALISNLITAIEANRKRYAGS